MVPGLHLRHDCSADFLCVRLWIRFNTITGYSSESNHKQAEALRRLPSPAPPNKTFAMQIVLQESGAITWKSVKSCWQALRSTGRLVMEFRQVRGRYAVSPAHSASHTSHSPSRSTKLVMLWRSMAVGAGARAAGQLPVAWRQAGWQSPLLTVSQTLCSTT